MLGLRTLIARSRPLSLPSLLRLITPTHSHLSASHLTHSLSHSPCLCSRQPPHRTFASTPDDSSSSSSNSSPPPPITPSNMPPRPETVPIDEQPEPIDDVDDVGTLPDTPLVSRDMDDSSSMMDENMNENMDDYDDEPQPDDDRDRPDLDDEDEYYRSRDQPREKDEDETSTDDGDHGSSEEPPGGDPFKAEAHGVEKARRYIEIEDSIEWLQKQSISDIKANLAKLQSDPFYQKWLRGKELESTYPQRLEEHFQREDYRLVNRVWPAVPIVHKGQQITATPTQRALHAERITSIDDYLKYHRTKLKVEEIRQYRNIQRVGKNIPPRPEYDWVRRLLARTRDDLEINPNWTSKQKVSFIQALHPRLLNYARDEHARQLKREADRKAAIEKAERQAKALAEANARDEAAKEKARQARAERRAAREAAAAKTPPPS